MKKLHEAYCLPVLGARDAYSTSLLAANERPEVREKDSSVELTTYASIADFAATFEAKCESRQTMPNARQYMLTLAVVLLRLSSSSKQIHDLLARLTQVGCRRLLNIAQLGQSLEARL